MELQDILDVLEHPFMQVLFTIANALILQFIGGRVIKFFVRRAMRRNKKETEAEQKKRQDTISKIFVATWGVLIWLLAAGVILQIFNVDFAKIATGAGVLGIIVGFGAQSTIRDVLAGIFILSENQYRVGDIVTLNGAGVSQPTSGVVEDITLRITRLRDLDGTLNIVRNGEASIITNRTYKYSSVVVDVGVAYDSDIDKVEKIMNEVGDGMLEDDELKPVIKEPMHFLRVDDFADSAIIIKTLGRVEPAKQWDIAGEYRRRLVTAFREDGIEIAFPQVVVHNAKD